MTMAAERRTWESRAACLVWRVQTSTRDTWHEVRLEADGAIWCTCEWAQNGGLELKNCKQIAGVKAGGPELPRPMAEWTDDLDALTAREWALLLET